MNFTNIFSNINPKEVLKNLPDAVLVIEADGKIVWANNKAGTIFEMKTEYLKDLHFDEIAANGLSLLEKSASKRNSVVTGAFASGGKEFFIEMNAKKYGEQYFVTIRDVTAMTNVLAAAEKTGRLNKEKNIMLVKLSNEIKSPIQSVIGFSQALLDGLGGIISDKQSKYVKIINKNSTELLYFMEKFLEFSQSESSLFTIDKQTFDVANAAQFVVKTNENALSVKNLSVNLDFENLLKRAIYSDENSIKRILQNLIENSIKLTDAGSITIKIDNPDIEFLEQNGLKYSNPVITDNYIRITVSDTGMGLAETELDGIFEPYTQLDRANKKTIVRSISLGTVHNLVKKLGGILTISSEVMKGTTFTVVIPVERDR